MSTVMTYLDDPLNLHLTATVARTRADKEGAVLVALDKTPFYAQGGGQPSDAGWLETASGERFQVLGVKIDEEGDAWHRLHSRLEIGDVVHARVDGDRRALHSRIHTAGELCVAAVQSVAPGWVCASAMHFPESAFVTFDLKGRAPPNLDQLALDVAGKVRDAIDASFVVRIHPDVARGDAEELVGYSLNHIPEGARIRLVEPMPGFFRACMGTHAGCTSDIGAFDVTSVKLRKGQVVLRYEVAGQRAVVGNQLSDRAA